MIGRIPALTHHPFETMLLRRLKELLAVIERVHQVQTRHLCPPEQPLKELPALYQRLRSEILAVQVQKIEGIDRELASLAAESSFEQSEKVWRTVRPREAQLGVHYRRMGRDASQGPG